VTGKIVELSELRYTPAGIPVVEFKLDHESEQDEAGAKRKVKAEISAVAFEAQARLVSRIKLNSDLKVKGFLSARTKRSKKLVLHVTNIEFSEGA
jgi:primosomal replication protein N